MTIKEGNTVTLEYEGKLETGEVFDSSQHGEQFHPLVFKIGEKKVIPGFEKNVIGMSEGEEKKFSIEADDAYGQSNPQLVNKVPKTMFPNGQEPKAGMGLMLAGPDGRQIPARIVKVSDADVTIDLNHPLAGKKLIFKIKVTKIE